MVFDIHLHIVLTDACNKLKSSYGIRLKLHDTSKSVEQCIEEFLPMVSKKDAPLLTPGVLRIIFDTSNDSIHAKGNVAAHETTMNNKLSAILSVHSLLRSPSLARVSTQ